MSENDFTDKLKRKRNRTEAEEPVRSTADTFRAAAPQRVPLHRTTVTIPVDVHELMRKEAFETGVSVTEQLITSWKRERGMND